MNGTVIDIPGIHVDIGAIELEDSTDQANTITIYDDYGNKVTLTTMFGKIIDFKKD